MKLNPTAPYAQGYVEATLQSLERYNCEPVESESFPGYAFLSRCKACGHTLRINQVQWRVRHWVKCSLNQSPSTEN